MFTFEDKIALGGKYCQQGAKDSILLVIFPVPLLKETKAKTYPYATAAGPATKSNIQKNKELSRKL